MAKHKKKHTRKRRTSAGPAAVARTSHFSQQYDRAHRLAREGKYQDARRLYVALATTAADSKLRAIVTNDMAVLDAIDEDFVAARKGFASALALDETCEPARRNLASLISCGCGAPSPPDEDAPKTTLQALESSARNGSAEPAKATTGTPDAPASTPPAPIRIVVLSFLFNWPSTGGGNIHTVELAKFLALAGYDVRHFYAQFPDWQIGCVTTEPPIVTEPLEFDQSTWNLQAIQSGFHSAVDRFGPDYVIIADSWNMKPILADGQPVTDNWAPQRILVR
jgi:hypothetical protein